MTHHGSTRGCKGGAKGMRNSVRRGPRSLFTLFISVLLGLQLGGCPGAGQGGRSLPNVSEPGHATILRLLCDEDAKSVLVVAHRACWKKGGARVWVNSLWDGKKSGGRGDEHAVADPAKVWGWLIDRGVSVIQTDEPGRLIAYLKSRSLHR